MSTELQIWCIDKYQPSYKRLQVLRVYDGKNALWLHEERIRAVVTDENPPNNSFIKLKLALVRDNDTPQWLWWSGKEWLHLKEEDALKRLDSANVVPDKHLRRLIVETIAYDHAQQIMGSYILRNCNCPGTSSVIRSYGVC